MTVKTRIAPSPTGFLHIGTARTALFNYIFAKQNNGKFILRIEDTDIERSKSEYEKDIEDSLHWLGLKWDEFYRQSERKEIYKKYLRQLLEQGKAFWCFHTQEELQKEKEEQIARKEAPKHLCSHKRQKTRDKIQTGIIRFDVGRVGGGEITFKDLIRGEISFETELLGDFSLAKDEESVLYNFAAVVDDFEMRISHVIRGEDHISNTPKQILLQKALGFSLPQYAHLPLILGTDRSKLSKRHGVVSVNEFRRDGYLPEALVNFMAFLGWNPGDERELFGMDDLIREFRIDRIQKGGAIFNIEKFDWLNHQYIQKIGTKNLKAVLKEYVDDPALISDTLIEIARGRLQKLSDIKEELAWLEKPEYEASLLNWKATSPVVTKENLKEVLNLLKTISENDFRSEKLEEKIMPLADTLGRGETLWPLRVALSGRDKSPGPFELLALLGKKESLKRIEKAIMIL